jgi:hypothetical protein
MSRRRIVIIDVSQSMSEGFSARTDRGRFARRSGESQKFAAALDHLQFAIQKMPPGTELVIIAFAESANVVFQGPIEDKLGIRTSISSLAPTGRSTNLASALELALRLVEQSPQHIQTLDVVTDGLSNSGDPVPPARALQQRCAVYIHIYLIDPTEQGLEIAGRIVGDEGEVDPVASEAELMGRQRDRLDEEEAAIRRLEQTVARHSADRLHFQESAPPLEQRPRVTASYPEWLAPGKWRTLEVFIYAADFRKAIEAQIKRLGQLETEEYGTVSAPFPRGIPEGCEIKVRLSSAKLRVNPSELTIRWYEPVNRLPFRVAAPVDHPLDFPANIVIEVLADDLPVSSMEASIIVTADAQTDSPHTHCTAQLYEDVFASFAREDLEIVRHLKKRYEALGIYLFIDVDDLRGGSIWRRELFQRIEQSDLFQLFWSRASCESEYVAIEWQHALKLIECKGGRFIRPAFWEEPMPTAPDALSHITFRKLEFISEIAAS